MSEILITKQIGSQPESFKGDGRFNDELMAEWHIVSTSQPDHINDVMDISPDSIILPPSGKGIALLNHDPFWTGGLPLAKVLSYEIVKDGTTAQLWQNSQYLKDLPDNIGVMTYQARKALAFTDSSIQFIGEDIEPVDPKDMGKSRWEWDGTHFKKWKLFEAGPVLMGMNWHTGNMKSQSDARADMRTILKKLTEHGPGALKEIKEEQRFLKIMANGPYLKINK